MSTTATFGTMTFSAGATGSVTARDLGTAATSNSVLVTPPLTFRATVNAAPTTFGSVTNTAVMSDDLALAHGNRVERRSRLRSTGLPTSSSANRRIPPPVL